MAMSSEQSDAGSNQRNPTRAPDKDEFSATPAAARDGLLPEWVKIG
jgi:hypothetical protein